MWPVSDGRSRQPPPASLDGHQEKPESKYQLPQRHPERYFIGWSLAKWSNRPCANNQHVCLVQAPNDNTRKQSTTSATNPKQQKNRHTAKLGLPIGTPSRFQGLLVQRLVACARQRHEQVHIQLQSRQNLADRCATSCQMCATSTWRRKDANSQRHESLRLLVHCVPDPPFHVLCGLATTEETSVNTVLISPSQIWFQPGEPRK